MAYEPNARDQRSVDVDGDTPLLWVSLRTCWEGRYKVRMRCRAVWLHRPHRRPADASCQV